MEDVQAKKAALEAAVREWVELMERSDENNL
jgi:hypothetical protein